MEKTLSEKEQVMYELVLKVLDGALTVEQAAARACCSTRTVYRNIERYTRCGREGLAHGSRGRAARNATPRETLARIVWLYENEYPGFNFTHFHQQLSEREGVSVSYPVVYGALTAAGHVSPRAHGPHARDEHPERRRRSAYGELVQMDASVHPWFGEAKCNLHAAVDDSTSEVLGAHFEEQETLRGYYMVFAQVLRGYGCPEEFYTDRRTVFTKATTSTSRLEDEAGTQFRMAAARMGALEIHASSVPQAKGRVERLFQTFQDRLVSEMRRAGVATIEQANAFLPGFVADHNARYALPSAGLERAFGEIPTEREIDMGLSVVHERTVSGGCVSFRGRRLAPYDEMSRRVLPSKTRVIVLQTLSGRLFLVHGEDAWPLLDVQTLDFPTPEDVRRKIYVPPKGHPWKEASYNAMLKRLRRAS